MCGLFGFTIYNKDIKNYSDLLQNLAVYSSERGTHATGISYNINNKMIVYKKPTSASKLKLKHFENVQAVTGHTRHATQGDYKLNYNNHPFTGYTKKGDIFSIAHNGIIYNDIELRQKYHLSKSKITTDSYIYTQLLEQAKNINFDTIREYTELLEGYYTFSILDNKNNLYIVKGDSPVSIVHLKKLGMYIYASTDNILYNALMDSNLFVHIKTGDFNIISLNDGDILKISNNGKISTGKYEPKTTYNLKNWYDFDYITTDTYNDDYLEILLDMASYMGYDDREIYALLDDGFTFDEIEDLIYNGEML